MEGPVRAIGQVNGAHAAAPQQLHRLPNAETRQRRRDWRRGRADTFVVFKQKRDLRLQLRIATAPIPDEPVAIRAGGHFQGGVEHLLRLAESLQITGGHEGPVLFGRRYCRSQASEKRRLRSTVLLETSRISAVSSTVQPRK